MMKTIRKVRVKDDPVLAAIKERLYAVLSENAGQIILFGSRARGDAVRDSDYDILHELLFCNICQEGAVL